MVLQWVEKLFARISMLPPPFETIKNFLPGLSKLLITKKGMFLRTDSVYLIDDNILSIPYL